MFTRSKDALDAHDEGLFLECSQTWNSCRNNELETRYQTRAQNTDLNNHGHSLKFRFHLVIVSLFIQKTILGLI